MARALEGTGGSEEELKNGTIKLLQDMDELESHTVILWVHADSGHLQEMVEGSRFQAVAGGLEVVTGQVIDTGAESWNAGLEYYIFFNPGPGRRPMKAFLSGVDRGFALHQDSFPDLLAALASRPELEELLAKAGIDQL
jgi:hypothetical protein